MDLAKKGRGRGVLSPLTYTWPGKSLALTWPLRALTSDLRCMHLAQPRERSLLSPLTYTWPGKS